MLNGSSVQTSAGSRRSDNQVVSMELPSKTTEFLPSLFNSSDGKAVDLAVAPAPLDTQSTFHLPFFRGKTIRQRKARENVAFAVLISVIATASFLFICYCASHTRLGTAFLGRALSSEPPHDDDGGDDDPGRLLESCLDLQDELGFSEWTPSSLGEDEDGVAFLAETFRRAAEEFEKSQGFSFSADLPPSPPSSVSSISPELSGTSSKALQQKRLPESAGQESFLSPSELPSYDLHVSVSLTQAETTAVMESSSESTQAQSFQDPGPSGSPSGAHSSRGLDTSAHESSSPAPAVPKDPIAASSQEAVVEKTLGKAEVFGSASEPERTGKTPASGVGGETPARKHRRVASDLEIALMQHPKGGKSNWVPRAKKSIAEIVKLELSVNTQSIVSPPSSWMPRLELRAGTAESASVDAVRPSTSREEPRAAGEAGLEASASSDSSTSSIAVTLLSGDVIKIHHPPPPMAADTHVYYRLPYELPQGGFRHFDADYAFFSTRRARYFCDNMAVARRLLAKKSLSEGEAQLLISLGERFVNYLLCLHQSSANEVSPFRACELLGVRYMCFDFLISLIQLFGPAANPQAWFPEIVDKVPTDFSRPLGPKAGRGKHFASFAYRLSAALRLLKQGFRPAPEFTIMLKRDLFRLNSGPGFFRLKQWEAWREDGDNL